MITTRLRGLVAALTSTAVAATALTLGASTASADDALVTIYGSVGSSTMYEDNITDIPVEILRAPDQPTDPWVPVVTVYTQGGVREPGCGAACRGNWSAQLPPGRYHLKINADPSQGSSRVWTSLDTLARYGPDRAINADGSQTHVYAYEHDLDHLGGSILSQVVDQCDESVDDVTVEVYGADDIDPKPLLTSVVGGGEHEQFLPAGASKVRVVGPDAAPGTVWLNGATGFDGATRFTVPAGTRRVEQPRVRLHRTTFTPPRPPYTYSRVRGYLTAPNDGRPRDVTVRLYRATYDSQDPWALEKVHTTTSGDFSLDVPPGEYRMSVNEVLEDTESSRAWKPYFVGGDTLQDAETFCVTAADSYGTYLTPSMAYRGRAITGTVSDAAGRPLKGVEVRVFSATPDADGNPVLQRTRTTGADGRWTTNGTTDQVKIQLVGDADQYTSVWNGGAETFAGAAPIDATKSGTPTIVDETLPLLPLELERIPYIKIHGAPGPGVTIGTDNGRWGPHSPVKFTKYQWYRVKGGTATKISGQTRSTYKIRSSDNGSRLKVQITASYAGARSATAFSELSQTVTNGASIKVTAKKSGANDVRLSIKVKITGDSNPWGKVTVYYSPCSQKQGYYVCRGRKTKSVSYKNGKGSVVLNTKRGFWGYEVHLKATSKHGSASDDGVIYVF
ncbi:carboxypeptidase-like regulatory domain-containing protein [Aeromicrobium stalagmiti]|uniref:carboxypeptidase-like regulatory domain-containing protein n=1 Tax=Aeromicrobium stalagmiti TaxID=2738988 RepID=UPI001567DF35|nr:carboxypeptidase-like regulatory domain-containing protein [Aeromicrobium stalagmiti]NRQ49112.1 carboxypeptidase regulatory-like domain-containing protein [Aeromicrobium stalagmiti]